MNYDEITKITTERINDYMSEAVNTDSKGVAEMFHNAAWGGAYISFPVFDSADCWHSASSSCAASLRSAGTFRHRCAGAVAELLAKTLRLRNPCASLDIQVFLSKINNLELPLQCRR